MVFFFFMQKTADEMRISDGSSDVCSSDLVPFLAGGIAEGALAISGQATSYLNPSQNAAEEAAREASTGNVSLGNSNLDNSTVFSRQFAQGALNPSISYGADRKSTRLNSSH